MIKRFWNLLLISIVDVRFCDNYEWKVEFWHMENCLNVLSHNSVEVLKDIIEEFESNQTNFKMTSVFVFDFCGDWL